MAREFARVGVVGLGTMGAGIAEVFARAGIPVIGVETDDEAVSRGRGFIEGSTDRAVARGKLSADDQRALLDRIAYATSLSALATVDLVVEAVPEHPAPGSRRRHALLQPGAGNEAGRGHPDSGDRG